jgi:hypothetical protein
MHKRTIATERKRMAVSIQPTNEKGIGNVGAEGYYRRGEQVPPQSRGSHDSERSNAPKKSRKDRSAQSGGSHQQRGNNGDQPPPWGPGWIQSKTRRGAIEGDTIHRGISNSRKETNPIDRRTRWTKKQRGRTDNDDDGPRKI